MDCEQKLHMLKVDVNHILQSHPCPISTRELGDSNLNVNFIPLVETTRESSHLQWRALNGFEQALHSALWHHHMPSSLLTFLLGRQARGQELDVTDARRVSSFAASLCRKAFGR